MLLVLASFALRGALACAPSDDVLDERPRTLVERELDTLRSLVLRLRRTRPEVFPGGDALGARRPLPDAADEQDVASLLGRELILLERTVALLEQSERTDDVPSVMRFTTYHARQELPLDLPADASVETLALVLRTVGRTPLVAPRLLADPRDDWSDIDALARAAVGEAREPAVMAERLWAFLVDERAHGPPPTETDEPHDPVKLLNVYGYGLCDDVANAYVHLARRLGLPARVWALGGHVVPEVFFEGSWHLFDPDHEVYYRGDDGRVLGVDDLAREPSLLLSHAVRRPSRAARALDPERVTAIYASTDDNRVVDYPEPSAFHSMDLVLGPGEQVVLQTASLGYRVTDTRFEPADQACNGEWTRTFALEQAGTLELPCTLPWPILGGTLHVALPESTRGEPRQDVDLAAGDAGEDPGGAGGEEGDGRRAPSGGSRRRPTPKN